MDRAQAGLDAARWREHAVAIQVERDLRLALAEFRIQRELVERYEGGVLAKVAESVAATQYAYDRGAASLLDVIDAIRAQQDARDDHSLALHDYWVSVYALNAAAGSQVARP
jgi:cobalt-zinc-cadmium efflux system outer membrane protein